jgi:hypothetical protein
MTYPYLFPDLDDPDHVRGQSKHRADLEPAPEDPADPYTSVTDAFIRYASTRKDLAPLSRVLAKDRQLRDALYKALDAEGAFDLSPGANK